MYFVEKAGTRIDSNLAKRAVEPNHRGEKSLCNPASLRDLLKKPLMNQVEELRHDCERGDIALVQSAQEFGGVEGFKIDNPRALDQGKEEIRHLRQNVEERQHPE